MCTTRASLLLRIQDRRDNAAWTEFDAIYRPMLHRLGQAIGLNDADAEDVVQHCMDAVSRHVQTFEYDPQKGRFKSWLRTIVNNRARNIYRSRHAYQADTQFFERLPDREHLSEEEFDKLWMEAHLRHALLQIRKEVEEKSFQAYSRYVLNGESIKRVCDDLGMNANQLYAIKFRINKKLHQRMKELLSGAQTD